MQCDRNKKVMTTNFMPNPSVARTARKRVAVKFKRMHYEDMLVMLNESKGQEFRLALRRVGRKKFNSGLEPAKR